MILDDAPQVVEVPVLVPAGRRNRGPFALGRTAPGSPWTLYHRPTGFLLRIDCGDERTVPNAICTALAQLPLDWTAERWRITGDPDAVAVADRILRADDAAHADRLVSDYLLS